jgi:DNA-binding transcriptional LysR family regulator
MQKNDPLSLDFAALRTLSIVYAKGSFSAAAAELRVNQSTVSYTIERLRRVFGDPLFLRQGSGITPTLRCEEIVGGIDRVLADFALLTEPASFDPETARAAVTISCNYYERVVILPQLVRRLRQLAPGITLHLVQSLVEGHDHIRSGSSALLLSPVKNEESGFFTRTLFSDRYVCAMDAENPLAGRTLTKETFCQASHVTVVYGSAWQSFYLSELQREGYRLTPQVTIPSPENLPDLLAGSEMISTIPYRVARKMPANIALVECPFPAPFEVSMYWTTRTHHSEMHRWLRGLIGQAATEIDRADASPGLTEGSMIE